MNGEGTIASDNRGGLERKGRKGVKQGLRRSFLPDSPPAITSAGRRSPADAREGRFGLINEIGVIAALNNRLDNVLGAVIVEHLHLLEDAKPVVMESLAHILLLVVGAAQLVDVPRKRTMRSKHCRGLFLVAGIVQENGEGIRFPWSGGIPADIANVDVIHRFLLLSKLPDRCRGNLDFVGVPVEQNQLTSWFFFHNEPVVRGQASPPKPVLLLFCGLFAASHMDAPFSPVVVSAGTAIPNGCPGGRFGSSRKCFMLIVPWFCGKVKESGKSEYYEKILFD